MDFISIDEYGDIYFTGEEKPVSSIDIAQTLLKNLKLNSEFILETTFEDTTYIVESFDHPLLVYKVTSAQNKILIHTQHQMIFEADIKKFSLDPFDRICGLTTSQAPFRLTEKAQAQLFDQCDRFDDDSFTLGEIKINTPNYYIENSAISDSDYWTQVYHQEKNQGQKPGWDLADAANAFKDMLPRLKLPKSRILVLGCGEGHDAAFFAEVGHVVTAIDFSAEPIRRAQEKYGHLHNLTFIKEDIFNISHDWNYTFDIIIEHTCFCAIEPDRRKELIKLWRRLLHEEGQIMALFFAMLKRSGPPYGSSEWELRELLKKDFHFLFWGRWRDSVPRRLGRELFVLAKKRRNQIT